MSHRSHVDLGLLFVFDPKVRLLHRSMIRVTIHGSPILFVCVVHKKRSMTDIHLLVLIHGMWGNPIHLAHMDKIIREVKGTTKNTVSDGPELAVLVAKMNSNGSTYDGIDWGGERVAQEVRDPSVSFSFVFLLTSSKILEEIQQHENRGKKVTRFSVMGCSLGGLVARYVIGYVRPAPRRARVLTRSIEESCTRTSSSRK